MKHPEEKHFNVETVANPAQKEVRLEFSHLLRTCPIPDQELVRNLALFLPWQEVARTMFFAELYQNIIDVPGILVELGTRWGRNLALFSGLRATFEPFNHNRKIVAFDTFSGLTEITAKDGNSGYAQQGALAVTDGYDQYLSHLLRLHEEGLPYEHMTKYKLVKGDASRTVPEYLEQHPETVIAFAYFDMDLYAPTAECLKAIMPYVTKGTVLAFDEINHSTFPGETVALREVLGLNNVRLRRSRLNPLCGYIVVE